MPSAVLNQIEETISRLSRKEQLWLIEQIAHHLREGSTRSDIWKRHTVKDQLVAMASDIEIQSELQRIDQEFTITEVDGLESE